MAETLGSPQLPNHLRGAILRLISSPPSEFLGSSGKERVSASGKSLCIFHYPPRPIPLVAQETEIPSYFTGRARSPLCSTLMQVASTAGVASTADSNQKRHFACPKPKREPCVIDLSPLQDLTGPVVLSRRSCSNGPQCGGLK